MLITPEEISKITSAPIGNVRAYYLPIVDELVKLKKNTIAFQVAILATIGVECGTFEPKREGWYLKWTEAGARAYFNKMYSNRKDLGNLGGDDGYRYRGGGLVQLTGRANYRKYGAQIGVDLEKYPELIVKPEVSGACLLHYLIDHGVDIWAQRAYKQDEFPEEYCWRKVRKLVNGGYNEWNKFYKLVQKFKEAAKLEGDNV